MERWRYGNRPECDAIGHICDGRVTIDAINRTPPTDRNKRLDGQHVPVVYYPHGQQRTGI